MNSAEGHPSPDTRALHPALRRHLGNQNFDLPVSVSAYLITLITILFFLLISSTFHPDMTYRLNQLSNALPPAAILRLRTPSSGLQ